MLQPKPTTQGIITLSGIAHTAADKEYFLGGWIGLSPFDGQKTGELFSQYGRAALTDVSVAEDRICFTVRYDTVSEPASCTLEPDGEGYWKGLLSKTWRTEVRFQIQESGLTTRF